MWVCELEVQSRLFSKGSSSVQGLVEFLFVVDEVKYDGVFGVVGRRGLVFGQDYFEVVFLFVEFYFDFDVIVGRYVIILRDWRVFDE